MKNIQNSSGNQLIRRNASDPFALQLKGKPYILRKEDLLQQIDLTLQRKREWYYPHIKVLSFSESTLILSLEHQGNLKQMTIQIEPDKLHVSCNCATPVETVCLHVYKALDRLSGYCCTDYFEKYSPEGVVNIARKHPKHFDKETNAIGISYTPKAPLLPVFRITVNKESTLPENLFDFPVSPSSPILPRETDICFIILVSHKRTFFHQHERFPALMPCSGLLNKAGNELKAFYNFLSGTGTEQLHLLTEDQQRLNLIGLEMWKLVEQLPGRLQGLAEDKKEVASQLFLLWEKTLPILFHQEFIYQYRLHRLRDLRGKPDKTSMIRSRLSKERPVLQFVLQDKGDYYSFLPVLIIRGVKHYTFDTWVSFFAIIEKEHYLLSSLKDAALLEWMDTLHGKLTVFKEHFREFEQNILALLRKSYTIE